MDIQYDICMGERDISKYDIPVGWDRVYILDSDARPVRIYNWTIESQWACSIGKQYRLNERMPDYGVEVTTYFSGWASLKDDRPPMFWTILRGGGYNHTFESETWEEAQDKHRRVVEKVRRVLPRLREAEK